MLHRSLFFSNSTWNQLDERLGREQELTGVNKIRSNSLGIECQFFIRLQEAYNHYPFFSYNIEQCYTDRYFRSYHGSITFFPITFDTPLRYFIPSVIIHFHVPIFQPSLPNVVPIHTTLLHTDIQISKSISDSFEKKNKKILESTTFVLQKQHQDRWKAERGEDQPCVQRSKTHRHDFPEAISRSVQRSGVGWQAWVTLTIVEGYDARGARTHLKPRGAGTKSHVGLQRRHISPRNSPHLASNVPSTAST